MPVEAPAAPVKSPSAPANAGAAPTPAAPVSTEADPANYMGDITADLEKMASEVEPEVKPPPKKDPATGKFTKQPEKSKEPEKAPEPEKAAEPEQPVKPAEEEPRPGSMRALGKKYDELVKQRDTVWQPELQKLRAEVAQLKSKPAPDTTQIEQRMSSLEKENNALKEEIRYVNYRKHPEFAEKYERPYNEAWGKAVSEFKQLNIETENGQYRKGTEEDLLVLANAPLDQVDDLAEKWFGKSAHRVIRHVEKIRDLADAQNQALETARKGMGEREKAMMEQQQKQGAAVAKAYEESQNNLKTKYPNWFSEVEGDAEGNERLRKGFELADSVFTQNGNLTPEQKASRLALIRGKAANHDRLAYQLKLSKNRISELETELKQYQESSPPTDAGDEPAQILETATNDWEQEIRKMAK